MLKNYLITTTNSLNFITGESFNFLTIFDIYDNFLQCSKERKFAKVERLKRRKLGGYGKFEFAGIYLILKVSMKTQISRSDEYLKKSTTSEFSKSHTAISRQKRKHWKDGELGKSVFSNN
jgi:hypothetical protein